MNISILGNTINITEFINKIEKLCKQKLTVSTSKNEGTSYVTFKTKEGRNALGFGYTNFPSCCAYGICDGIFVDNYTFKTTNKVFECLEEMICHITYYLSNTAVLYVISDYQTDLRKLFIKKGWKRIGNDFENNNSCSKILTYRKIVDRDKYEDDDNDD